MTSSPSSHRFHLILVTSLTVLVLTPGAFAGVVKPFYSFAGGADGEYLDTELARDSAGNLYGTSVQGGLYGSGTVFQVTPAGEHIVLYNFTGANDGGEPYKGVTLDASGNLYGTAVTGGSGSCEGGCGVLYKVTNAGGSWTQSVVHAFSGGNDGSGPGSPVSFDANGNLFGTTPTGGAFGMGVLYEVTAAGHFHIVHTFTGGADGGGGGAGPLLIDAAGNLYGVCTVGGVNGFGTVYEISRSDGKFITLYAFKDSPDGALPYGGLVFDKVGNLYGTTYYAGANDLGTVYTLRRHNGTWTERVLYSFKGGSDGAAPISTLVAGGPGVFFGTTSDGGAAACVCGVIFKVSLGSTGWAESVVFRFPGKPGPGFAYNGMITDSAGNYFGTTVHGGATNDGMIYQFTP